MSNKFFKIIGLITVIFFCFVALGIVMLGVSSCNTEAMRNIEAKNAQQTEQTPTVKNLPEKIESVTAEKLIEDYEENEIKANNKYQDKTFIITGRVTDISEVLSVLTVTLNNEPLSINAVSLKLKDKDKNIVAKLKKGKTIEVKGKIKGKGIYVDVTNVEFIKY